MHRSSPVTVGNDHKIMKMKIVQIALIITVLAFTSRCRPDQPMEIIKPVEADVDVWLTKGDQSALLEHQTAALTFDTLKNSNPSIVVDETQTFQTVDGFGYTLTGGSVEVINTLNSAKKRELLQNLFGQSANDIGISYLRISIGASDLNASVFS